VIEARLFDIHLKLAELAAAEARRESRSEALLGRRIGLSRESVAELREDAPTTTLDPDSEAAHILMDSATWSVAEWMALTPDRRLFLFDAAQGFGVDAVLLDRVAIGILDELIAAGEGEQVEQWIPRVDKGVADPRVWSGRRGQQLLDLDLESGFQERSVIALHRGVAQLERGELDPALQLLAYAMNHGPESKDAEAVQTLSLRWLSYVASGFEITEELLTTLEALVPRREYVILLEDMMWRAAFRADARSFDVGLAHLEGRGALERRLEVLDPLARGDVGAFLRLIRGGLAESPSETLRLLDQLLERLEREDAEVRAAQLPTLRQARELLQDIPGAEEAGKAQARKVEDLLARSQAIIEGLEGLGMDASVKDRARALAPGSEVFAGALRLAPVDPLPWPFRAAQSSAPSIFTPMELVPVEWRDADGEWVFGWAIRG
ncbi:MAG: hypothetical protein H6740_28330, partial [Alphaproteobacteria bacterium]|nr:hypothetical protein [Alphaproteobacteria bacterium]